MHPALSRTADFFRCLGGGLWRHPFWLLGAVPLLLAGAAVALLATILPQTPTMADIRKSRIEYPTVVMSADGKELAVFRRTNREWVKLSDVSPKVLEALLATEDHRFFEHHGLDVRRTLSAALHTARGDLQGGSTISQQLARNLYPEEIGRAPTLTRKVKEAITAFKIESVYSKNDILEMYLNTVPFLYNAYGIEMAARTYFDKSAGQLDVLESATLIGMLKGTRYYNPVLNPERAVQRRNIVLAQLVKHGKLPRDQFDMLKKRPLSLDFEKQEEDLGPAPHLAQQLRRWLITWADSHGYNMNADGLVVHTTIDSRLQQLAVEAVTRQADKLQAIADKAWAKPRVGKQLLHSLLRETPQYKAEMASGATDEQTLKKLQADPAVVQAMWREKTHLQAAFLAQDPVNGHVKAWVGSRDFNQDQFDHVQQARRQPGSTFKPFVYGAAFAQGISPAETFVDEAVEIQVDAKTVWKPSDAHEATGLPTTLRDGLVYSKNTITAQLIQRVGVAGVAQVAQAMGVRQSKLDLVPSLALGTSPVTLKEMVSAYSTIANSGSFVEPVLVTRIESRNHGVLEEFRPRAPEQGLATQAAQTLLDVMRGVIDRGTGAGIRSRFGIQGDVAGKTGTTQDNTDGWFILMHPNLVSGAWVGFNDNRITMGDSWGQGANNALNIVGDFFQQSVKAKAVNTKAKFTAPRDPGVQDPSLPGKVNDWLGGAVPAQAEAQRALQPAVIAEPSPAHTAAPEPAVVAVPAPPAYEPAPAQRPEFRWSTPERQRSTEYQASPGFSPGPPERQPQIVIRTPDTAEMGAPPAPAAPADGGIRILREVRPEN
jgi:penicillin-binding protein 1A